MKTTCISKNTFKFLKALSKNNNREWFNSNKPQYIVCNEEVKAFGKTLQDEMSHIDEIEGVKTFRIYRDVRFSKDKSPYKNSFSGGIKRATKWKRGGMYFHFEPGKSFAGGGFWSPNPADLKRIREEIARDDKPLRKILKSASFKKNFGEMTGDAVKTSPKGFSKEHPAIDLLRHKQFLLTHSFTDQEVHDPKFLKNLVKVFKAMQPFFNYMSEVLTTDANGVPIP